MALPRSPKKPSLALQALAKVAYRLDGQDEFVNETQQAQISQENLTSE